MTKLKENRIKKILQSVENPLYWLSVMVALHDLTESEAGYIIYQYKLNGINL